MKKICDLKKDCTGCGSCQAVCPVQAITMQADKEGFLYPEINSERCIDCGACKEICDKVHTVTGTDGRFYALRCSDMELLRKSSSGGAFSLIADKVIAQDGVVCGVAYDDNFHVHHIISDDISGMRKSKYVQSDMDGIYEGLREELQAGRKVLFTGTPCQCQGVKEYVKQSLGESAFDDLYLAALICRGVQSPELWEEYVAYLSAEEQLTAYDCRNKRVLNDAHTVVYKNGDKETAIHMNQDKFSRLYIKCLTLRPSCYSCQFCRTDLEFDFTIGDFWGVKKLYPELADGAGTSLVIARSEKAIQMMDGFKETEIVHECDKAGCIQEALQKPAPKILLRKLLFMDLARKNDDGHCDMELILKKYGA